MNYYDLLGVPPAASPDEVRTAYRTMAQIFHPDRLAHFKPEARQFAEERLKSLNLAYGVLSDPAKRAAYDATLNQPPPPNRAAMPSGRPPAYTPPAGPTPGASPGSARRSQMLERRQRLARLEAEIVDLSRNVAALETEQVRARVRSQNYQARAVALFWVGTLLTGLGFNSILAAAVGLFSEPALLTPTASRLALVGLVGLYEFWSALTLSYLCRMPGTRVGLWSTVRVTGWGLAFAWPVGLVGWGLWAWRFGAVGSLASLLALVVIFMLAHVLFCWLAVGHLPRVAREQQRVLEYTYAPMLQAYEHQLAQLRAQKSVLESETA